MFPHQYGPPAWAQQQNSQNQAPYWAQPNPYGAYQQPPFIPPQPPQAPHPTGYHPGGIYGYQAQQPNWSPQPAPPQESDPTDRRSNKWPRLSAILAADTTLARFKVSGQKPSQEIFASTFYLYRNVPANATPTNRMRLYSKQFPWALEINTQQQDITCEIVWNFIWSSLQQPIEDSEWGFLCSSGEAGQTRMKNIVKANKKRVELNAFADKRILRCDYLCEDAWFLGLERDEEYQNTRVMPNSDHAKHPMPDDTWLIKMGK